MGYLFLMVIFFLLSIYGGFYCGVSYGIECERRSNKKLDKLLEREGRGNEPSNN